MIHIIGLIAGLMVVFFMLLFSFFVYLEIRKYLVSQYREEVRQRSVIEFDQLPSEKHMVKNYFVWPLSKFNELEKE